MHNNQPKIGLYFTVLQIIPYGVKMYNDKPILIIQFPNAVQMYNEQPVINVYILILQILNRCCIDVQ